MAANAATRKPRAATTRKPRRTRAQIDADNAAKREADMATATEQLTETVHRVTDAPEVPGGAVVLSPRNAAAETDRDTLFSVDGAGYTIPRSFSKVVTLGYAHVARKQGLSAAIDWAMEQALGSVGYAVLLEQDVPDDVLDGMIALVIARVEGLLDPK